MTNQTQLADELLPCPNPWCAGQGEMHSDARRGDWWVSCDTCCLDHPARCVSEAEAITAWNTRAALRKAPDAGLAAELDSRADQYSDGIASFGPNISPALAAASSLHYAAELVRRNAGVWPALVEGLHAQIFGVQSLGDAALSHAALADGGAIHEAAHALIRALPALSTQPGDEQSSESLSELVARLDDMLGPYTDSDNYGFHIKRGNLRRILAALSTQPDDVAVLREALQIVESKACAAQDWNKRTHSTANHNDFAEIVQLARTALERTAP